MARRGSGCWNPLCLFQGSQNVNGANSIEHKSRERHHWNGDVTELHKRRFHARFTRGITRCCRICGTRDDVVHLDVVMIRSIRSTNKTQGKNIARNGLIALPQCYGEQNDLRIHEDPLNPTILARCPTRDLGEIEATQCCCERDNKHQHQSMLCRP